MTLGFKSHLRQWHRFFSPFDVGCLLFVLQLFSLQNKLNATQMEYLALKMNSEEEILSLKQQVQVMQKASTYSRNPLK